MPYYITKNHADCQSGWAVVDSADAIFGCHPTKQSAIDQAVAISISDKEPFVGERAMNGELSVGDYVTWDEKNPNLLGEVEVLAEPVAAIRIYELENTIYSPTDNVVIMNIWKLKRVPRPEMTAEKWKEEQVAGNSQPDLPDNSVIPDGIMTNSVRAEGEKIIILDIDNTVVRNGRELIQKNWDYVQSLEGAIFIVTGRPESQRDETIADLDSAGITYSRLIMNPGSSADSPAYKRDTAAKLLETYDVIAAIDDNDNVRRYYSELGIDVIDPATIPANDESRAVNQSAPAYMRAAARQGLKYYEEGKAGDGVVDKTIAEARLMANGEVSDDKWIRIAAWIARHLSDLDSPNANPTSDQYPSPGVVAHLLWGSGPSKAAATRAMNYAESVVARIKSEAESRTMPVATDNRTKWLNAATAIIAKLDGSTDNVRAKSVNETRTVDVAFEVRESGDGMSFEGYAAMFNSDSTPLPFIERIAPGAFKRSLQARNDIKLLWNHDTGIVLGSTRAGTLRLVEDSVGLKVMAELPPTTAGKDAAILLKRGDVAAMSFGFTVPTGGDSWDKSGNVRTLNRVSLHEVSLVAFPAYGATTGTTSVRSADGISADALADALLRLELGEELDESEARLVTDVVSKLTKTPDVQEVDGDILALKKKKLDLLMLESV